MNAGLRAATCMGCLLFLLLMPVAAGADWFPVPVRSWPTLQADGRVQQSDYQPLLHAAQAWPICVVLPHRKDDYWRAVDWGLKQEAARLGVRLGIYYGGGYDDLPRFNRLLEQRCLAGDYRAVIIGALSETGHEALLEKFAAAGKSVIDLINGMDSRHIAAKSLLSFSEMGAAAARQLNATCARENRRFRIAWFPGPQGAGWVREGDRGFREALDGRCGEIVYSAFADTGIRAQQQHVELALATDAKINLIAGTAVTATIAVGVLDTQKRRDVVVLPYYLNSSVWKLLKEKKLLAAPTDSPVLQSRIAVDLAVRALEKRVHPRRVSPQVLLIDARNLKQVAIDRALAPEDQ